MRVEPHIKNTTHYPFGTKLQLSLGQLTSFGFWLVIRKTCLKTVHLIDLQNLENPRYLAKGLSVLLIVLISKVCCLTLKMAKQVYK